MPLLLGRQPVSDGNFLVNIARGSNQDLAGTQSRGFATVQQQVSNGFRAEQITQQNRQIDLRAADQQFENVQSIFRGASEIAETLKADKQQVIENQDRERTQSRMDRQEDRYKMSAELEREKFSASQDSINDFRSGYDAPLGVPSGDGNIAASPNPLFPTGGGFESDLAAGLGDSPLAAHAQDFIEAGREYGIDPRALAAISRLETGNGTSVAFAKGFNAMGISGPNGPTIQESVRDSIFEQARKMAAEDGPYAGANTLAEIGSIYAPPGAGNDTRGTNEDWPSNVSRIFQEFNGNPEESIRLRTSGGEVADIDQGPAARAEFQIPKTPDEIQTGIAERRAQVERLKVQSSIAGQKSRNKEIPASERGAAFREQVEIETQIGEANAEIELLRGGLNNVDAIPDGFLDSIAGKTDQEKFREIQNLKLDVEAEQVLMRAAGLKEAKKGVVSEDKGSEDDQGGDTTADFIKRFRG